MRKCGRESLGHLGEISGFVYVWFARFLFSTERSARRGTGLGEEVERDDIEEGKVGTVLYRRASPCWFGGVPQGCVLWHGACCSRVAGCTFPKSGGTFAQGLGWLLLLFSDLLLAPFLCACVYLRARMHLSRRGVYGRIVVMSVVYGRRHLSPSLLLSFICPRLCVVCVLLLLPER